MADEGGEQRSGAAAFSVNRNEQWGAARDSGRLFLSVERSHRNSEVGTHDDRIESRGSRAYHYLQIAVFRMVMPTDDSANVVERYEYDAEFR